MEEHCYHCKSKEVRAMCRAQFRRRDKLEERTRLLEHLVYLEGLIDQDTKKIDGLRNQLEKS